MFQKQTEKLLLQTKRDKNMCRSTFHFHFHCSLCSLSVRPPFRAQHPNHETPAHHQVCVVFNHISVDLWRIDIFHNVLSKRHFWFMFFCVKMKNLSSTIKRRKSKT
ncbi:hypothetical protein NL108_013784 [Boleophthalmus pectinirostris]|nr:hypothetical protein NL108_013784 [Boleophthalmus pectinirostris]